MPHSRDAFEDKLMVHGRCSRPWLVMRRKPGRRFVKCRTTTVRMCAVMRKDAQDK